MQRKDLSSPAMDAAGGASVKGRQITSPSMNQPQLDCPRCGSAAMRFRSFDGGRRKPQYFCSCCRMSWTKGAALRLRKKKKPHAASAPPSSLLESGHGEQLGLHPPTHQASHVAPAVASDAAVSTTASFALEASHEWYGLQGAVESAFLDWIDDFLQSKMQEDFKAAFFGGGDEIDDCDHPPSPPDGDQELEHKSKQQQWRVTDHGVVWNGSRVLD